MRFSITFGLGALILSFAAPAVARPDLNSFLNRKVESPQGLVAQIQNDPQVADRYERHFAMSKGQVVSYVGGLHRERLSEPGVYTVYSVPRDGHLKMHVERLKKGEAMFVDSAGKPTLIVKCGNPVTLGPRRANRGNPVALVPTDESGARDLVADVPDATALDTPNLVALAPPVPEAPPVPPIVVPPVVEPPVATVPASGVGGGGGRFPWIAGLPLLIPIFGSGHHGGGGDINTPEPATMAVLGVGVVALARRRRKN